MPLRYLLDTNVVSELTKTQPNPGVLEALAREEADCAISAPTLEELVFGCRRLPQGARQAWLLRWVEGLPAQLPVLPFDEAAAFWLGSERARPANAGRPLPRTDGEIAAVAKTNGLTLVTRNTQDFVGWDGLVVENWHS